jgi:hypothetical protein
MAEPLRREPDPIRPEHNLRLLRQESQLQPGSSFRSWWFWVVLLIVAIGISVWGYHSRWWGGKRTVAAPVTPKQVAEAPPPPQTYPPTVDVHTLLANPVSWAGKEIRIRDVLVRTANDDVSVFVGARKTEEVLVVLGKNSVPPTSQGKPQPLQSGMILTLHGTVEKAPASIVAMRRDWKLSLPEAREVSKTGYYVQASQAQPQIF